MSPGDAGMDAGMAGGGAGTPDHDSGSHPDGSALDAAGPAECDVVAPTSCPEPKPTYADVEPIFQERCVGCHAGIPDGPWPLTDYGHVSAWFGEIRGAMLSCSMPPADAGIEMPTEERDLILLWIRCGFPR